MPTDREFENHLDVIAKYAARIPVNLSLVTPDAPIIEDRRAIELRRKARNPNSAQGEDFTASPEFNEGLTQYAEQKMSEPGYVPGKTDYFRFRNEFAEIWQAKHGNPAAAKVG